LIPLKSFDIAKQRLRDALNPEQRKGLAEQLATAVISAARPLPVFVVSSDPEVEQFVARQQALFIRDQGAGLNAAVKNGVEILASHGFTHVAVMHGDLPLAVSIADHLPLHSLGHRDVIMVPDRHHDGTNVLVVNAQDPIPFRYGSGSFAKHCVEASQRGLRVTVLHHDALALDIDTPADLLEWQHRQAAPPQEPPGNQM
jgi:2-phospho-L-lactate/phosphoenolpyruvate guanylyltransferase